MKNIKAGFIKLYNPETGKHEHVEVLQGESAYQAAVRLGKFTGTEEQWVEQITNDRAAALTEIENNRASAVAEIATAHGSAVKAISDDRASAVTAIQAKGEETLAKIPNDYTKLAGDVSQLSSDIGDLYDNLYINVDKSAIKFAIGGINAQGEVTAVKTRVRTDFIYALAGGVIKVADGYKFNVATYNEANVPAFQTYRSLSTEEFYIPDNCYIRVGVGSVDDVTWTDDTIYNAVDALDLSNVYSTTKSEKAISAAEKRLTDAESLLAFENMLLVSGGINMDGKLTTNNAYVRTANYVKNHCSIRVPNPYVIRAVAYYNSATLEFDSYARINSDAVEIGKDGCVALVAITLDNSTPITPEQLKNSGDLEYLHFLIAGNTVMRKSVDYAPCSVCGYYSGLADDYTKFGSNTTYASYIAELDAMVADYDGYVTKTELGQASDNQVICAYTLKPKRFDFSKNKKKMPKIIIIGGQHGFEKSNVFGLYYLIHDLLNNWQRNEILDYLRHHVEFVVVPIVNPWGFDNRSYYNANGVNINRNYDANFAVVDDATSTDYGGQAAFDQPESRIVRDLVLANLDAVYFIDSHSNGSGAVTEFADVNWMSFGVHDDDFYAALIQAAEYHLSNITAHFEVDYNIELADGDMCGHITSGTKKGTSKDWVLLQGMAASTVEGFNGFPGGARYTAEVKKANSEILGNWVATAINTMRNA